MVNSAQNAPLLNARLYVQISTPLSQLLMQTKTFQRINIYKLTTINQAWPEPWVLTRTMMLQK